MKGFGHLRCTMLIGSCRAPLPAAEEDSSRQLAVNRPCAFRPVRTEGASSRPGKVGCHRFDELIQKVFLAQRVDFEKHRLASSGGNG